MIISAVVVVVVVVVVVEEEEEKEMVIEIPEILGSGTGIEITGIEIEIEPSLTMGETVETDR